jgi:dipeptidyl-peptidase 4
MKRSALFAFLFLCLAAPVARAQNKQLTLDDLFDPTKRFSGSFTPLQWLPDGKSYLQFSVNPETKLPEAVVVNAADGTRKPFHDGAKIRRALQAAGIPEAQSGQLASLRGATFNANATGALVEFGGDLYALDLVTDTAKKLTSTPDAEEEEADFSPDGKKVTFVRGNNLFFVDIADGKEKQLTTDGSVNVFNGALDWVYEEEVYGRGKRRGYWWNPGSTLIAYLRLDETAVPIHTVIDDIPQAQRLENTKYPKSGDPNPKVQLGVVSLEGVTAWIDLSAYAEDDRIVTRVGWEPDGYTVIYQVQNRIQNVLDLNQSSIALLKTYPPKLRPAPPKILFRDESKAWVDVVELPEFLPDGSFIVKSDRTGNGHIYKFAADGKLEKALTSGEWDVREIYGVADGYVYFSASEHSPIANHIYRVKTDGTGFARLSQTDGTHTATFNNQKTAYFDYLSTVDTPTQVRLHGNDGKELRVIDENKVALLGEYKWGKTEFTQVKTRDGFTMEAMKILPPDFDPSKKYPVWCYTYSGPQAQSVLNRWGGTRYLWHQLLAQKGYIVWICDNRSASNKGVKTAHPIYRNLGELELRDLEDGLTYLKQQPYVDGSRIGLWGWSYGGYMTSYALTHSQSFKIGIIGAPVTDWRNYDSIYTERYMGVPKDNVAGYDASSPAKAAANLHGKVLLIHGLIDDNVHPQNSVQFIDAMQKANKQFQFMAYPQSRHGVTSPYRVKHMYSMMTRFVEENL